jgi:hypothetical protein
VRRRVLTAEQAAANTVMSGCLPEYFPVVLATMQALFDPNDSFRFRHRWAGPIVGPLRG